MKQGNRYSAKQWANVALWRRVLLFLLVLGPAVIASAFMANSLPHPGYAGLDDVLSVVFGLLFGWISIGFWISIFGAYLVFFGSIKWLDFGAHRFRRAENKKIPKTAVLIPTYCEDPRLVSARIESMYCALKKNGLIQSFDFFWLSDSDDPDFWIEEEMAWAQLRSRLDSNARVFYRRRRSNIKRKSGNIADFCRRWGIQYEFMIVLDADSLMSAEAMATLVDTMCRNESVGLIQTVPATIRQNTLFGRIQQFSNRLYGPLFSAGMHYFQLGEAHYWGHNAIIRIAPFMRHCALPKLSHKGLLGGEILSHDFVEAALLRRAGWSVWLAYDVQGSYEEAPPTLLDELKRDRRWAQGNLQHMRLIFSKGLHMSHRLVFLNGVMGYLSSFFWFVFLLLSSVEAICHVLIPPDYFPHKHLLFPVWPVWHPHLAILLSALTIIILFAPKLLAIAIVLIKKEASQFGGTIRLLGSALIESLFSTILAPIRMLFHTLFILSILFGFRVKWGSQVRGDQSTSWKQAIHHHGWGMFMGLIWGGAVYFLNPGFFWWMLPVMGMWLIAIPISVLTSTTKWGESFRKKGFLLTPEETAPPPLLADFSRRLRFWSQYRQLQGGFVDAVVDPGVNALHCALLGKPKGHQKEEILLNRRLMVLTLLKGGPMALSSSERMVVLSDRDLMKDLHHQVWSLSRELFNLWHSSQA